MTPQPEHFRCCICIDGAGMNLRSWCWQFFCREGKLPQSLGNAHDFVRLTGKVTQVGIVHAGSSTLIDFFLQFCIAYFGTTCY